MQAKGELNRGTLRAPTRTTLAEAAEEWLAAAQSGIVRTRSGDPYKPSALRAYEQALRTKLVPALGHLRLSSVTHSAVQDLVDRLVAEGHSPSTVRNAILPLRAIYRPRARALGGLLEPDGRPLAAGGAGPPRAGGAPCRGAGAARGAPRR